MAKESLFNFIPEGQLTRKSSDPEFRVSITKSGMLYFPREVVETYDLDRKYFKFFADPQKKAIAWRYFSEGDLDDLSRVRKLGINQTNKAGQISIQKLLSSIGIKELEGVISDIPVREYKGSGYLEEAVKYVIVRPADAKKRSSDDLSDENLDDEPVSDED